MPDPNGMTERQKSWMASVRATLERDTGRSLDQWAELARACPETAHRKRLAWMKAEHGLGQNMASLVLNAAFPGERGWDDADALADALWTDPAQRAVFEAVKAAATALPDVVTGQRKAFTAFSREFQFASLRPTKAGVRLGLAVEPDADARLVPPKNEGWSERLKGVLVLGAPDEVDATVEALLKAAWERS
jgi:hypothetical protein